MAEIDAGKIGYDEALEKTTSEYLPLSTIPKIGDHATYVSCFCIITNFRKIS